MEGMVIGLNQLAVRGTAGDSPHVLAEQRHRPALIGAPLNYAYSIPGMWGWLVLVIMLSALASFIPARNASKLTVREVLFRMNKQIIQTQHIRFGNWFSAQALNMINFLKKLSPRKSIAFGSIVVAAVMFGYFNLQARSVKPLANSAGHNAALP
jgi:hypothetical protein